MIVNCAMTNNMTDSGWGNKTRSCIRYEGRTYWNESKSLLNKVLKWIKNAFRIKCYQMGNELERNQVGEHVRNRATGAVK